MEKSLTDFHRGAWPKFDPAVYQHNWHIEALADHLEAVTRGHIKRLIITEPPRTMKSSLVSVSWPAWTWAQSQRGPLSGPQVKFIGVAYSPKLAIRDATKTRRVLDSRWYLDRWADRFQIMTDKDQKAMYENTAGGFRFSTSISGELTGEGGDILICLPAGVMVETDRGLLPVERIVEDRVACKVLGYDTAAGKTGWQAIEAYEANPARAIIELDFGAAMLRCTGDHPVFTLNRGYVPAGDVGPDDACLVRKQSVMFGVSEVHLPDTSSLGEVGRAAILQPCLPRDRADWGRQQSMASACSTYLQGLWQRVSSASKQSKEAAVLFAAVFWGGEQNPAPKTMPSVRGSISPQKSSDKVLQPGVCEYTAFRAYGWGRKRPLRSRGVEKSVWAWLDNILERARSGAGRLLLPQMWLAAAGGEDPSGASYQLRQGRHEGEKPDFAVPSLSRQMSRHSEATAGVERVFLKAARWLPAEPTFNIRVGPHHNYFANGLLVHNCDDPINAKKSNWESAREAVNTWWDETVPTRLNDLKTGAFVIIMQRLHEDDLVGHILSKEDGWVHLNLPMEFDPNLDTRTWVQGWDEPLFEDPRVEPDELLWPDRFPRDEVDKLKISLGPFGAAAQLQQQPSPRGGGIIDRMWWQLWDEEAYKQALGAEHVEDGVLRYPPCSLIVGSIDTAYGDKDENAWNAMTTWGIFEDKRSRVNAVMMEAWRARLPLRGVIPEGCQTDEERKPYWGLAEKIADTVRRRNVSILLIENKTRGNDLGAELRRLLRNCDCSIILLEPEGNKVARLHANQAMFADGRVWAPNKAWAETVITEVSQFPKSKFADYVDTCSQCLSWLRNNGVLMLGTEADTENLEAATFRPRQKAVYDV